MARRTPCSGVESAARAASRRQVEAAARQRVIPPARAEARRREVAREARDHQRAAQERAASRAPEQVRARLGQQETVVAPARKMAEAPGAAPTAVCRHRRRTADPLT